MGPAVGRGDRSKPQQQNWPVQLLKTGWEYFHHHMEVAVHQGVYLIERVPWMTRGARGQGLDEGVLGMEVAL